MSFSTDQRAEIIEQPYKTKCCRYTLLQGVLAARARDSGNMISISVDSRDTAEFIAGLIKEIFSKDAEISNPKEGGRRKIVSFVSPAASRYLSAFMAGELYYSRKCLQCQAAFLRGLFLAAGRASDPEKQYLLEFSVGESTDRIFAYFDELGLVPRISKKPKETVIYFKKSAYIEDFFALANMNNAAFAFMNAKINGELRNNVNRIINFTTSNIDKSVSASVQQITLIRELEEKGLLSQLPEELESTARLRMEHDDLSLSQLSALTTPRVSKSGLSHRLKRIVEAAKEILKDKDNDT